MTQDMLLDTHEQLAAQNALMKGLLRFIQAELTENIRACKRAPLDSDGTKDMRKVNIAAFCTQLLNKISQEKTRLTQERKSC